MIAVTAVARAEIHMQVVGNGFLASAGGIIFENIDLITAADAHVAAFVEHPECRPPAFFPGEPDAGFIITVAETFLGIEADGASFGSARIFRVRFEFHPDVKLAVLHESHVAVLRNRRPRRIHPGVFPIHFVPVEFILPDQFPTGLDRVEGGIQCDLERDRVAFNFPLRQPGEEFIHRDGIGFYFDNRRERSLFRERRTAGDRTQLAVLQTHRIDVIFVRVRGKDDVAGQGDDRQDRGFQLLAVLENGHGQIGFRIGTADGQRAVLADPEHDISRPGELMQTQSDGEELAADLRGHRVSLSGEGNDRSGLVNTLSGERFDPVGDDAFDQFRIAAAFSRILVIVLRIRFRHGQYRGKVAQVVRSAQRNRGTLPAAGLEFDRDQIFAFFELDVDFVVAEMRAVGLIAGFQGVEHAFSVEIDRHEVIRTGADRVRAGRGGIQFGIEPGGIAQFPLREERRQDDQVVIQRNGFSFDSADLSGDPVERGFEIFRDRRENRPMTWESVISRIFAGLRFGTAVFEIQFAAFGGSDSRNAECRDPVLVVFHLDRKSDLLPVGRDLGTGGSGRYADPFAFGIVILQLEKHFPFALDHGSEFDPVPGFDRNFFMRFQSESVFTFYIVYVDRPVFLVHLRKRLISFPGIEGPCSGKIHRGRGKSQQHGCSGQNRFFHFSISP